MNNRLFIFAIVLITIMTGCDESRIYETNTKLLNKLWIQDSVLHFDFQIDKSKQLYNLYANIQYANDFNYRNLYVTYILYDSMSQVMDKSLVNINLFSDKLGRPFGSSAIGDIYELQTPIISNYQFPNKGKYSLSFQQYMRVDSLYNLTSVGLRVEKSTSDQ